MRDRLSSPTMTRTICVRRSLFTLTSFERSLMRAQQRLTQRIHKLAYRKAKNKICNAVADPSRADTQNHSQLSWTGVLASNPITCDNAIYRQLPDRQLSFRIADDPLRTNCGFNRRPSPRLPDYDRGAYSFDRREEHVRRINGVPKVTVSQRQNEGEETVYKGHNDTRDDVRQPVRSKRKQSTRHNHGDGYFHQDR